MELKLDSDVVEYTEGVRKRLKSRAGIGGAVYAEEGAETWAIYALSTWCEDVRGERTVQIQIDCL